MIKSVEILDIDGTAVKWLSEIRAFKEQKTWEFTPGLNILWGKNGSGKSSLLRLLARMFHCEQGQDEQKTTSRSVREMIDWAPGNVLKTVSKYDAVRVEHDGSPVNYMDASVGKGQIYAGAFDDDFFNASFASHMFKGSSGETTNFRLKAFIDNVVDGKFKKPDTSKVYKPEYKKIIDEFLIGTLEADRPTVLLDEPDKSLDITNQVLFWSLINRYKSKCQIIIAAHNLFACDIEGANYITFSGSQYLEDCRTIKRNMNSPKALEDALRSFVTRTI